MRLVAGTILILAGSVFFTGGAVCDTIRWFAEPLKAGAQAPYHRPFPFFLMMVQGEIVSVCLFWVCLFAGVTFVLWGCFTDFSRREGAKGDRQEPDQMTDVEKVSLPQPDPQRSLTTATAEVRGECSGSGAVHGEEPLQSPENLQETTHAASDYLLALPIGPNTTGEKAKDIASDFAPSPPQKPTEPITVSEDAGKGRPASEGQPPSWRYPAGIASIALGLVAFCASAAVGGGGTREGSILAGLLNPFFFIGVPLGGYWLYWAMQNSATAYLQVPEERVSPEPRHTLSEFNARLIHCPDCGGRVSRLATSCPHCGRLLKPASLVEPDNQEAK